MNCREHLRKEGFPIFPSAWPQLGQCGDQDTDRDPGRRSSDRGPNGTALYQGHLLTWPRLVLSSSWSRDILMLLQVVATGGTEHMGSLSDCSTFLFTSLRLVLSCAVDLFSSFKVLFTFNKASLVSLIAVGTHLVSEQKHPPGRQWKLVFIYKEPSGNWRWT